MELSAEFSEMFNDTADAMYHSTFPSSRTSISSHESMHEDPNGRLQLCQPYLSHSNTDSPPGYQYSLPSPVSDEVILNFSGGDREKRREQNRLAQRAFRERKESKLKQLEKQITKLKTDQRHLERKYHSLRTAHLRLQSGMKILLEASGTFDDFESSYPELDEDDKR